MPRHHAPRDGDQTPAEVDAKAVRSKSIRAVRSSSAGRNHPKPAFLIHLRYPKSSLSRLTVVRAPDHHRTGLAGVSGPVDQLRCGQEKIREYVRRGESRSQLGRLMSSTGQTCSS